MQATVETVIKVSQKKDKEKEKEREAKVKEREAQEEHQAEAAAEAAANNTDAPKQHLSGYWGHKSTVVPAGQLLAAMCWRWQWAASAWVPPQCCAQPVMSSLMSRSAGRQGGGGRSTPKMI